MTKKKYSINWENGEAVSFEVNGIVYKNLDGIPNPEDMQKLAAMMNAAEDEEFFNEQASPTPNDGVPIEKIVLGVFTGVSVLLFVIALISAGGVIWTLMTHRSAPGRVVDMVVKRQYVDASQDERVLDTFYYPVVNFVADDGKRRSVQMSIGSNIQEYEKGDEVTVMYDPKHPLDARIKSFGNLAMMWILPGITGILGISFLGAVWIARSVIQKEEAVQPA